MEMKRFAERTSELARRALLFELYTTPKPGLVDLDNNGAHRDMDVALFERSTDVLAPFFLEFLLAGAEYAETPEEELLRHVRPIGVRAEEAMFEATGGVNTHKGLIFSMGIFCCALGYQHAKRGSVRLESVWELVAAMGRSAVRSDLGGGISTATATSGLKQYLRYGLKGIRGEVAAGMPSVRLVGLRQFETAVRNGDTLNDAGCKTLLFLLGQVDDSNVVARSSLACGQVVKESLRGYLAQAGTIPLDCARRLDRLFIEWNLSPGGCADLLALTYFVYLLRSGDETTVEGFLAQTEGTRPQEPIQGREQERVDQLLRQLERGLYAACPGATAVGKGEDRLAGPR